MTDDARQADVLVVGAGPAGLAAAARAAESGVRVAMVDSNPEVGGQIWRRATQHLQYLPIAREWIERVAQSPNIERINGAYVAGIADQRAVAVETAQGTLRLGYRKIVLATGARELLIPFPGWTLPNVVGAGALQAMAKEGLAVKGKRIVVAGSGPLLLAAATSLHYAGASIACIVEQAPWWRLARFALHVVRDEAKLRQGRSIRRALRGVPYHSGAWPVAAYGDGRVEGVTLRSGLREWRERCDYLACSFRLIPNVELAALFGCRTERGAVVVDQEQRSSIGFVYCAGEISGIGGLERALVEGEIAGYAASGQHEAARALGARRAHVHGFSRALDWTFALRGALRRLATPETVICRCEEVRLRDWAGSESWRAGKAQARCGSGSCEGRICCDAAQFLFNWKVSNARPPIYPDPASFAGAEI
ncbi:FAD-dependent oxidoreductase [bacterium]|nr:MAG: FAD-dependent oxidoreductase [bacterium]